ncbi:MAG: hypothetical protein Q8L55_14495 [Phycisphaerales bacterium]|nr:hypothetical protein [Phycisphaerales bacterium]
MKTLKTMSVLGTVAAFGIAALAGCNQGGSNSRTEANSAQRASISVTAPSRDLLVGDTATFIANTANTYGRDAKVKWTATGGKLTTDDGGRVARVRFDETGTYTVKATLELDGNPQQTEAVDVHVRSVK